MAAYEILFEAVDQASPAIQKLSQQFIEMAQKSDQYAAGITNANIRAAQSFSQVAPRAREAADSIGRSTGRQPTLKSIFDFCHGRRRDRLLP
jgi:hypothetical protein